MSLPDDLRHQARMLATHEPRRPKQATLRRAVSTAYYALFHLLVDSATKAELGGSPRRRPLRSVLARSFDHTEMAAASRSLAGGTPPRVVVRVLGPVTIPQDLKRVALAFVALQERRQEADYDPTLQLTRSEVLAILDQLDEVFAAWTNVKSDPATRLYLALLSSMHRLQGRR